MCLFPANVVPILPARVDLSTISDTSDRVRRSKSRARRLCVMSVTEPRREDGCWLRRIDAKVETSPRIGT